MVYSSFFEIWVGEGVKTAIIFFQKKKKQFFSMYHTMTLIDGLSDREAVIQEVRMFRYFQRRIDGMRSYLSFYRVPFYIYCRRPQGACAFIRMAGIVCGSVEGACIQQPQFSLFLSLFISSSLFSEMELQMESLDTFELPRRVIGNDGDVDYLAVDADDEGM